jgi:hypothetical protein
MLIDRVSTVTFKLNLRHLLDQQRFGLLVSTKSLGRVCPGESALALSERPQMLATKPHLRARVWPTKNNGNALV